MSTRWIASSIDTAVAAAAGTASGVAIAAGIFAIVVICLLARIHVHYFTTYACV